MKSTEIVDAAAEEFKAKKQSEMMIVQLDHNLFFVLLSSDDTLACKLPGILEQREGGSLS